MADGQKLVEVFPGGQVRRVVTVRVVTVINTATVKLFLPALPAIGYTIQSTQ